MTDEQKKTMADERPAYEAPQALRLDGTHTGTGGIDPVCQIPGSSADGDCATGAGATGWCFQSGNSANIGCDVAGNDALGNCSAPGSGVVGPG
jgi:hypothetical protein